MRDSLIARPVEWVVRQDGLELLPSPITNVRLPNVPYFAPSPAAATRKKRETPRPLKAAASPHLYVFGPPQKKKSAIVPEPSTAVP